MRVTLVNTGPLIALAKLNRLHHIWISEKLCRQVLLALQNG